MKRTIFLVTLIAYAGAACAPSYDSEETDPAQGVTGTTAAPPLQQAEIGLREGEPPLSNSLQAPGNSFPTGLRVRPGDTLEVTPVYLMRELRVDPDPKTSRIDNPVCVSTENVCVQTEPVYERRCEDHCHVCIKCQPFPPSCYPWRCCDNVCEDVKVSDRCIRTESRCNKTENQWRELVIYEEPQSEKSSRIDQPMTEVATLLEGLKLRAVDLATGKPLTGSACPLKRFKPKLSPKLISVPLANAEGCEPIFPAGVGTPIGLELVNEVQIPQRYQRGTLIQTWDHRILQSPVDSTFWPKIDFAGRLVVPVLGSALVP